MEGLATFANLIICLGRKRLKKAAQGSMPCLKSGLDISADEIKGTGSSFGACREFVTQNLFSKKDSCSLSPCSFDGVFQPQLQTSFPPDKNLGAGTVYAFSYFYDKTYPYGLKESFTVGDIASLAEKKCSKDALLDANSSDDLHICMDLGFIHSLLSVGYDLPPSRELRVLKKINGFETGWCLGAAIQLIDSLTNLGSESVCRPMQ